MKLRAFFSRKIFIRGIGLVGLLFLLGVVVASFTAHTIEQERKGHELGTMESFLLEASGLIKDVKFLIKAGERAFQPHQPELPTASELPMEDYYRLGVDTFQTGLEYRILTSSYDYQEEGYQYRLFSLKNGQTLQRWFLPYEQARKRQDQWRDTNRGYLHVETGAYTSLKTGSRHPWLLPNGDLVSCQTYVGPLIRLTPQGKVHSVSHLSSHHSLEADADGNLWFCSNNTQRIRKESMGAEGGLVKVSPQGEMLFKRQVFDLFRANPEHDYSQLNFKMWDKRHLNDVQPVLESGPYWQKGDVFLSLRNLHLICLYRPSKDSILWSKIGPWSSQHDVDVINDSVITIFDNNREVGPQEKNMELKGRSRVLAYNFAQDSTYELFADFFEEENIRSEIQGLVDYYPQDSLLWVESTQENRMLLRDFRRGKTYQFVIPAPEGRIQHPAWTRLLPPGRHRY